MRTIGEQAKAFRESRDWTVKEMAAACKTSRQNIETLEAKGARTPRYIKELAKVMGTTVDVLMEGRYRVGSAPIIEAPAPAPTPTQQPRAEAGEVMSAVMTLAGALSKLDKPTREGVAGMLAMLAKEPEQNEYTLAALGRLLTPTNLARIPQQDRLAAKTLVVDLPDLNKEPQGHAKRIPNQGRGRT